MVVLAEEKLSICIGYENGSCLIIVYSKSRAGQGQGRAGQGRAGQGRAGQGRAGQGRAGQGRAGQKQKNAVKQRQPLIAQYNSRVEGQGDNTQPALAAQRADLEGCVQVHFLLAHPLISHSSHLLAEAELLHQVLTDTQALQQINSNLARETEHNLRAQLSIS